MSPIRLIHNTAELSGTWYFEFLPGVYRDKCWNEESVFLAEDVFGLVESIIARHEPQFDHYAFVEIRRPVWVPILKELEQLAATPDHAEVAKLAADLAFWLHEKLVQHECVSVLGM